MNKGKPKSSTNTPTDTKDNKVGQLFPNSSLEDYAKLNNRVNVDHDGGEVSDDSEDEVCDDEDDNSTNEDCDGDDDDNGDNVPDQMNVKNE